MLGYRWQTWFASPSLSATMQLLCSLSTYQISSSACDNIREKRGTCLCHFSKFIKMYRIRQNPVCNTVKCASLLRRRDSNGACQLAQLLRKAIRERSSISSRCRCVNILAIQHSTMQRAARIAAAPCFHWIDLQFLTAATAPSNGKQQAVQDRHRWRRCSGKTNVMQ